MPVAGPGYVLERGVCSRHPKSLATTDNHRIAIATCAPSTHHPSTAFPWRRLPLPLPENCTTRRPSAPPPPRFSGPRWPQRGPRRPRAPRLHRDPGPGPAPRVPPFPSRPRRHPPPYPPPSSGVPALPSAGSLWAPVTSSRDVVREGHSGLHPMGSLVSHWWSGTARRTHKCGHQEGVRGVSISAHWAFAILSIVPSPLLGAGGGAAPAYPAADVAGPPRRPRWRPSGGPVARRRRRRRPL